jgi:osmoprotectant transport system permease protein
MKTFENAIQFLFDNTGLIWDKTVEHVWLSLVSLAVACVIAIPLGVWLGHRHRGSFVAINVSNIGRALPSLAVISIGLGLLGVGFTNVMVALVILAGPVMLTNAYVAVDRVDQDAVMAARAMGMTGLQVLWRVELPLALPLMFAGIRTAAVYVVATAPLAALAGGGGLGDIIVNQPTYGLEGVGRRIDRDRCPRLRRRGPVRASASTQLRRAPCAGAEGVSARADRRTAAA